MSFMLKGSVAWHENCFATGFSWIYWDIRFSAGDLRAFSRRLDKGYGGLRCHAVSDWPVSWLRVDISLEHRKLLCEATTSHADMISGSNYASRALEIKNSFPMLNPNFSINWRENRRNWKNFMMPSLHLCSLPRHSVLDFRALSHRACIILAISRYRKRKYS